MGRNYISLFFSFVFFLSVCTPSILYVFERSEEAIVIVDVTEEENKENEMVKDFEIKFLEIATIHASLLALNNQKQQSFYLNFYTDYFDSINLPPPEIV